MGLRERKEELLKLKEYNLFNSLYYGYILRII